MGTYEIIGMIAVYLIVSGLMVNAEVATLHDWLHAEPGELCANCEYQRRQITILGPRAIALVMTVMIAIDLVILPARWLIAEVLHIVGYDSPSDCRCEQLYEKRRAAQESEDNSTR